MATKMTAVEVTERINKAQEVVNKLEALICRREGKLKKLQHDLAKASDERKGGMYSEKQLIEWSIEDEQTALEENRKKLPEKKAVVEKWQRKLEEINAESRKLDTIPEQLKRLQKELVEKIVKAEIEHRERIYEDSRNMSWDEFSKKHSYHEREYYTGRSDRDFKEMVTRDAHAEAKYWILDLMRRVEKKVGEITEWNLYFGGIALNGWVVGTKGKAFVETIIAGGYNIQCLHNRVLVK